MSGRDDVVSSFKEIGLELTNEVVDKCVEVCSAYDIDATELVETWMAFSAMNCLGSVPTLDIILEMEKKEFSKRIRNVTKTPKRVESFKIYKSVIPRSQDDVVLDIYNSAQKEELPATPKTPRFTSQKTPGHLKTPRLLFSPASYSSESISVSQKYADRDKSGKIICSFGDTSSICCWESILHHSAKITPIDEFALLSSDSLYMFEVLSKKRSALCEQTIHVANELVKKHNLDVPTDLSELTLAPVTYVGRIYCDNEYKLNASSILLEYAMHESFRGECVELDISGISDFSLFPGQIVAFHGKNPTSKKIFAEGCIHIDASPPAAPEPTDLTTLAGPLQMVISVGPYTPSDTLSYEPIEDLFNYVCEHKPHVLMIIGPIVDALHPLILEGGKLAETFAECYDRILKQIVQPLSKTHTKVIVVSSWREAGYHVIYPTPPSSTDLPNQYPNLIILPDPSVISVNGLYVGLTSTDILMHLGKEEIFQFSDTVRRPDRLSRLASYIIQQRHFYPLMPADDEMSVDYQLWLEHGRLSVVPHLLILPSDLHYFMKIVNGCLVINPERLTKGTMGGNFVRLEVRPPVPGETWSVATHINADILKI